MMNNENLMEMDLMVNEDGTQDVPTEVLTFDEVETVIPEETKKVNGTLIGVGIAVCGIAGYYAYNRFAKKHVDRAIDSLLDKAVSLRDKRQSRMDVEMVDESEVIVDEMDIDEELRNL